MSSKCIKTPVLATAIAICTGVGFSGLAQAHYRANSHYGWHPGWHRDWHAHRSSARYEYAPQALYANGGYGGTMGAACGVRRRTI